jgi:hypothetical protein
VYLLHSPKEKTAKKRVESLSFKQIDALHVAAAEQGQAEVPATCDDGLLKTVQACRHITAEVTQSWKSA